MGAQVTCETETLPWVAERMREWIPQLDGRAIAVTDSDVTKDNVPTLPIALVAPLPQQFIHNGGDVMTVAENFVIEIWLAPIREIGEEGELPFWAYYEYNKFRNKLFNRFAGERTPQNGAIEFISMDVESNFLATVLTFRARATYDICRDEDEWEEPAEITFDLCQPRAPACPPVPEQESDKCLAST